MPKKFDLAKLMPNPNMSQMDTMQIQEIELQLLEANENNFYAVDDIEDLKESIELIGLQQPLVVMPANDENHYTLIAGHRRLAALKLLDFKTAPCIIANQIDKTREELALIFTNSTGRVLSWNEKSEQAKRIEAGLLKLKSEGVELKGKMRTRVAELMKISETELARVKAIDNNLSDDWKSRLKAATISSSVAYNVSKLDEDTQSKLFEKTSNSSYITDYLVSKNVEFMKNPWALTKCPAYTWEISCTNFEAIADKKAQTQCESACCYDCELRNSCDAACESAKRRDAFAQGKAERELAISKQQAEFDASCAGKFPLRLKLLMERKKIDAETLSEFLTKKSICAYNSIDISEWLSASSADCLPDISVLIYLSDFFNCSADYLCGLTGQQKGTRFCADCELIDNKTSSKGSVENND